MAKVRSQSGPARMPRVGVMELPNLCRTCGKFRRWEELTTHFVPDTSWSSEDQSWRECVGCRKERMEH